MGNFQLVPATNEFAGLDIPKRGRTKIVDPIVREAAVTFATVEVGGNVGDRSIDYVLPVADAAQSDTDKLRGKPWGHEQIRAKFFANATARIVAIRNELQDIDDSLDIMQTFKGWKPGTPNGVCKVSIYRRKNFAEAKPLE